MRMFENRYIFLDQNHWIYLAKACWRRPHKEEHMAISNALYAAVERDDIRLPLNVIHLIEFMRAEDRHRRRRLAEVFERFSRGWFFADWHEVLDSELSIALAETFGGTKPEQARVFGMGFLFGFKSEVLGAIPKEWSASTAEQLNWLAEQPGALRNLLTYPNEAGRTCQNRGVSELSQRNAKSSEELRQIRRPYSNTIHLKAQYAKYTIEFQERIVRILASMGKTFEEFLALGSTGLCDFWAKVPSLDVDSQLLTYRDRQWSRAVQENDFRDIGHLCTALPYCDTVLVERFWKRAIEETGLASKYGVNVLSDLSELDQALDSWGCLTRR